MTTSRPKPCRERKQGSSSSCASAVTCGVRSQPSEQWTSTEERSTWMRSLTRAAVLITPRMCSSQPHLCRSCRKSSSVGSRLESSCRSDLSEARITWMLAMSAKVSLMLAYWLECS